MGMKKCLALAQSFDLQTRADNVLEYNWNQEFIQPFITSITSISADNILEAAKDPGGARVIEVFLGSDASAKLKRRLVMRLRGHFGEPSLHSSGSFTVEKCYTTGNLSQREAIVSELVAVQSELWNTRQGPHLMRNLDVDGFVARPDQWRSTGFKRKSKDKEQSSKKSARVSGDEDVSKVKNIKSKKRRHNEDAFSKSSKKLKA